MRKIVEKIFINGNPTGKTVRVKFGIELSIVGKAILKHMFPELQLLKMEYSTMYIRDKRENYFRANIERVGEGFSLNFDGCGNEVWGSHTISEITFNGSKSEKVCSFSLNGERHSRYI